MRETAHVHNPVLALPAAQRIIAGDAPWRDDLRELLMELRDQAIAKGDESLRKNKYMMFAYWRVAGVYMTHIARVLGTKPAAPTLFS
jgi:hypothetical protein